MIITLTGYMGSGKSSVGKELSSRLGWPFIDLDGYIVHKKGMSIPEIFATEGETAFRSVEAECLRDIVTMHQLTGENAVLSLGGGTVTISSVQHLIFGQTFSVYLSASVDTILQRIGGTDSGRPLFDVDKAAAMLEKRRPLYEKAGLTIVTDGKTPAEIAQEIIDEKEKNI